MDDLNLTNAAKVLERFKRKEPVVVEYMGQRFLIKKLPATAFLSAEVMGLPFVQASMAKWKTLKKEEQLAETITWLAQKSYRDALKKVAVLESVLEPQFSDEDPCPEGCVPYGQVDDDLVEFLSTAVLAESNFDGKASEFFRSDASGEAAGTGPGREEIRDPAEPTSNEV